MKELPDKNKNSKPNSEQRKPMNCNMPDYNSKWKNKKCWKNRPELKRLSSSPLFENKGRSDSCSKNWKRKEKGYLKSMLYN